MHLQRYLINFSIVYGGATGSGKTRLLHFLAQQGAQVLDLEALACHKGSIFGGRADQPQPSQKALTANSLMSYATLTLNSLSS